MFLNNKSYDNYSIYGNIELLTLYWKCLFWFQLLWHFSIMIKNNITILSNSKLTLVQTNSGTSENLNWWWWPAKHPLCITICMVYRNLRTLKCEEIYISMRIELILQGGSQCKLVFHINVGGSASPIWLISCRSWVLLQFILQCLKTQLSMNHFIDDLND